MSGQVGVTLRSGPWTEAEIRTYLRRTCIPIRLATAGKASPLVQSLWYLFDDDALWCCTQADSVVAKRLRRNPNCGFEISADQPPYRGIRGTGLASLSAPDAADLLPKLFERYSSSSDSQLAAWLLSRIEHEVAIRIDHLVITSWDYSNRM